MLSMMVPLVVLYEASILLAALLDRRGTGLAASEAPTSRSPRSHETTDYAMLFDLRGAGRRRTVKVIYVTLAFLMGGGLVLFGVGGAALSGGLVDAITTQRRRRQRRTASSRSRRRRRAARQPDGRGRLGRLARARFQLAGAGDNSTRHGRRYRRGQGSSGRRGAWEQHLQLARKKPDARVASLMVQAYSAGSTTPRRPPGPGGHRRGAPTPATLRKLALLAYQAGQTRKGDLARDKALELTETCARSSRPARAAKQRRPATTVAPTPSGDAGRVAPPLHSAAAPL